MGRYMICQSFINPSYVTWVDMEHFGVCNFFTPSTDWAMDI